MRKERLVPNSMQVNPRDVATISIRIPRKPEMIYVIIIRKIRVKMEIFV